MAAFCESSVSGLYKGARLAEAFRGKASLGDAVASEISRDRRCPLVRKGLVDRLRAGRIGMGEHVYKRLAFRFHGSRDLKERCIELGPDAGASGGKCQLCGNSDHDCAADLQNVQPHAGGLRAQLAVKVGHVAWRSARTQRSYFRGPHLRCAGLASPDNISGEVGCVEPQWSEGSRAGERRRRGRFAAGDEGDRTAKSDRFQHPAKVHVIGLPTDEKERMKLVCSTAGSDGESVTRLVNVRRAGLHSKVPRL